MTGNCKQLTQTRHSQNSKKDAQNNNKLNKGISKRNISNTPSSA